MAQTDSVLFNEIDSLHVDSASVEAVNDDKVVFHAQADSTDIANRSFDEQILNKLKSDPELLYKEPPTVAESLWDRFLKWLRDMLDALIDKSISTNWGNLIVYIIALVAVIVIIMVMLKVDAFKIFFSAAGKSTMSATVIEENIHEMDFDKLIQEALAQNDFRKGVRLTFLFALKLLSDKQYIHWESGKTNHDYINELTTSDLQSGFNELNYYFEYAWYGNFPITKETFIKIQHTFTSWRDKVR